MSDDSQGPGSIAANLHEGSRSEYLAQFVFSSFGTAIPVPHQEDSGLDIYCTLMERIGQRAWPRAYYSVQVKSSMEPWVFNGAESVRWLIEHPLPIFLCIVQKSDARILVYHTSPRFAAWVLLNQPPRLELIPENASQGQTVEWVFDQNKPGNTFRLKAPILNFTIADILDPIRKEHLTSVLQFWIDYDVENLLRIKSGIHSFWVPGEYTTNSTEVRSWVAMGGHFRPTSLPIAKRRLGELLSLLTDHYHRENDITSAAIYALALRYLVPDSSRSRDSPPVASHEYNVHTRLNEALGIIEPSYLLEGCDSLLRLLKTELARHESPALNPPE
ncbi:MAG TPA: hypothetical protein VK504_27415 [Vicinamibacterales bacterium]|nr:hypothetical protein [Vicinamibacterales bacterium]